MNVVMLLSSLVTNNASNSHHSLISRLFLREPAFMILLLQTIPSLEACQ